MPNYSFILTWILLILISITTVIHSIVAFKEDRFNPKVPWSGYLVMSVICILELIRDIIFRYF